MGKGAPVISSHDRAAVLNRLTLWEREGSFPIKTFEHLQKELPKMTGSELSECLTELIADGFLGKTFTLAGWKRPSRRGLGGAGSVKRFKARQPGLFDEEEESDEARSASGRH